VRESCEQLQAAGFELSAWGSSSLYNLLIEAQGLGGRRARLPDDKLVIAAGNNKRIWDEIMEFRKNGDSGNPFDDYSEEMAEKI